MQILHTIEEIHKIFPTNGSSPALVTCNDFRDWVCKYDRSPANLFNELIAAKFAKIWGILTPEIAFINVKREHVPLSKYPSVQHSFFDKLCFGSLYLESSTEIDLSMIPLFGERSFVDKLSNKEDFLKIALFDLWLANEDRNRNNFNLLLFPLPTNCNFFYAIDHVNIFNSSFLNYGIANLTEDDSIIKTEIAKMLFKNKRALNLTVDKLVESFYLCTKECKNKLDEILYSAPESWKIDEEEIKEKLIQNLFTDDWNTNCVNNFRAFIQSFIIN